MLNLQLLTPKAILYISIVVALVLAVIYVRGLQEDSRQLDVVRGQYQYYVARNEQLNAASTALETKLNILRKQKDALEKEKRDELKNPIYTSCIVPDNGVRLLNRAISGLPK